MELRGILVCSDLQLSDIEGVYYHSGDFESLSIYKHPCYKHIFRIFVDIFAI